MTEIAVPTLASNTMTSKPTSHLKLLLLRFSILVKRLSILVKRLSIRVDNSRCPCSILVKRLSILVKRLSIRVDNSRCPCSMLPRRSLICAWTASSEATRLSRVGICMVKSPPVCACRIGYTCKYTQEIA